MWTRSSNTMLGTVFNISTRYCKNKKGHIKNIVDLEITRHRKKPPGGDRHLTDRKLLYLFNAWYKNKFSCFTNHNTQKNVL